MPKFSPIHKKCLHLFSLFLLSQSAFATLGHPYVGGTVDLSFAEMGNTNSQITYYDGQLTDSYPLNSNNSTRAVLGLNGGYEFSGACYRPAIALGLGVYTAPTAYSFHGQVNESAGGDPSFLLYNYHYNVRSTRAMAEAQFSWQIRKFAPFINVGIGSAWNRLSGYKENVATPDGYVVQPPFQSKTAANFAYQVGAGVAYTFNFCGNDDFRHERISLGYRYVNAGNLSSGIRDADYPYDLNAGDLKTNSVYLGYTHFFG